MNSRIAILAALPREIAPLVRDWPMHTGSRREGFMIAECDRAIAVCAGMGSERVTRAMEIAENRGPLRMVISVGYAGALHDGLQRDIVYWPKTVIEARTGERYECRSGSGTLVTADHVVGNQEKLHLAEQWNADLVDMEAASVARLARKCDLQFHTLRAVSDDVHQALPEMDRFTNANGGFRQAALIGYIALHPWWIPAAVRLGRNAAQASQLMARALREFLEHAE